jgi:hypothetical protein
MIAGNVQYLAGLPWAATAQIYSLPLEGQRVLLEPRGSRRLSAQKLLDLRLSKPLHLGERGQAELLLDMLNVLDSSADEGLVDDNYFSPNFGRPKVFVDPRRAMLGVPIHVGKATARFIGLGARGSDSPQRSNQRDSAGFPQNVRDWVHVEQQNFRIHRTTAKEKIDCDPPMTTTATRE